MEGWLITFLLTAALADEAWGLPLACVYNGISYKEGEAVKVEDPCLLCTCRQGSLTCNLRVCPDAPDTTSPGCFIVHKANDCCPQLLCEDKYADNGVEIRTVFKTENGQKRKNDCVRNGTVYAEGSAVGSSQICEYCYCIRQEIKCIKPHCYMPLEGCKPIYHETSCCPTHYDCRNDDGSTLSVEEKNYGCEKNGIHYPEGEMIPSGSSSKCESCYCMKGKIECAPVVCALEPHFHDCRPLAEFDECCPSGFSCANTSSNFSSNLIPTTKEEIDVSTGETKTTEIPESEFYNFTTVTPTELPKTEEVVSTVKSETETTNTILTVQTVEEDTESTTFSVENTTIGTTSESFLSDTTTNYLTTSPSFLISNNSEGKITSKLESDSLPDTIIEDIIRSPSNVPDEYDNYDYNEPRLPPSLPNLVIFPFVAADAVVNYNEEDQRDSIYLDNKGSTPFFSKDFSPPKANDSILWKYEAPPTVMDFNVPVDPFGNVIKARPAPNLSSTTTLNLVKSSEPKTKPVTVTYKNVILDYYPNYLVTSPRDNLMMKSEFNSVTEAPSLHPSELTNEQFRFEGTTTTQESPVKVVRTTEETFLNIFPSEKPHTSEDGTDVNDSSLNLRETNQTTSFLSNLLKSLLELNEEEQTTPKPTTAIPKSRPKESLLPSTTTTTVAAAAAHRLSSGQVTPKPSSTNIYRDQDSSVDSDSNSYEKSKTRDKLAFANSMNKNNSSLGNLLKLAGCNIYGRMYRVGKIISELSGPCLECGCTDLGVQCTPLNC